MKVLPNYLLNSILAYQLAIVEFNTLIKVLPNWLREPPNSKIIMEIINYN